MIVNLAQFERRVMEWAKRLPQEAVNRNVRAISIVASNTLVDSTPVDLGEAKGGWHVSLTKATPKQKSSLDPSGAATKIRNAAVIASVSAPWPVVTIYNNVPHIAILERGGFDPANPGPSKDRRKGRFGRILVKNGYSVQAPRGMLIEARQAVSEAIKGGRR